MTKNEAPEEERQPFSPLFGAVLTQMFTDSRNTTNTLLDNYRREIRELRAELAAIRMGVSDILAEPYAPSASAIERAVFSPSRDLIRDLIAEEEAREHAV